MKNTRRWERWGNVIRTVTADVVNPDSLHIRHSTYHAYQRWCSTSNSTLQFHFTSAYHQITAIYRVYSSHPTLQAFNNLLRAVHTNTHTDPPYALHHQPPQPWEEVHVYLLHQQGLLGEDTMTKTGEATGGGGVLKSPFTSCNSLSLLKQELHSWQTPAVAQVYDHQHTQTNQRLFIYLCGTLILWATLQRRARQRQGEA